MGGEPAGRGVSLLLYTASREEEYTMIDIDCLLCVEDDASNRLVMKLLVEKTLNAKRYVIFEDSADFISRLQDLPVRPDIILLDIHVSPFNGFQMLKMIREDAVYGDTKVVALTA